MKPLFKTIIFIIISFSLLFLVSCSSSNPNVDLDRGNADAVYFGSTMCLDCIKLQDSGILDEIENMGFALVRYYIEDTSVNSLLLKYFSAYGVPRDGPRIPVLFVGETYFLGSNEIADAITSGQVHAIIDDYVLLELRGVPVEEFSILTLVLLGLVDGFNPCAIATLLMFISLLNFTKKKRTLFLVSLTFISSIFISYFLFGTILFKYLGSVPAGSLFIRIVPWVIVFIATVLFLINFHDFIMTYLQKYELIKNQLPSKIQKFNRRLINYFTKKMDEGKPTLFLITFLIGVIISFTEFLCTGQAYLTFILHLVHSTPQALTGILLLLLYNLIFVLPLIVIAIIAIKSQSAIEVSNVFREKLHFIKLFNALVFLGILIYYLIYLL